MSEEPLSQRFARIIIARLKYVVDCNVRDEQMVIENTKFIRKIPDGYTETQILDALFELFMSHYQKSPMPSTDLRIIPKPKTFITDVVLERKNNVGNDTNTFVWNLIRRQERPSLGDVVTNKTHDMRWITSIRIVPFNLFIANNGLDTYQFGVLIREFYQQSYRSAKGFRYNFVLPNGVPSSRLDNLSGNDLYSTSRFSNLMQDGALLKFSKPIERLERITMSFYKTDALQPLFTMTTRAPNIAISSITGVYSGADAVMFTLTGGFYNSVPNYQEASIVIFQIRGVTTTDPVTDAAWIASVNSDFYRADGAGPTYLYPVDDVFAALTQDGATYSTIRYVCDGISLGAVVPIVTNATFTILSYDFKMHLRIEHLALSS